MIKCAKGTFDVETLTGECPESCDCGHWTHFGSNMAYGVGCGASCLKSDGILYALDIEGYKMYCTGCKEVETFTGKGWD